MKSIWAARACAVGAVVAVVVSGGASSPVVAAPGGVDVPPVAVSPDTVDAGVTDRFVVTYRDEVRVPSGRVQDAVLTDAFAEVTSSVAPVRETGTGAQVWDLGRDVPVAEVQDVAASVVASDPAIESVVPDVRVSLGAVAPDDTLWDALWGMRGAPGTDVLGAWDVTRGAGSTVAVIDTGYRPHADLVANVVGGYDMVSDLVLGNDGDGRDADAKDPGDYTPERPCSATWHGTHVAGTIGAVARNGVGVAGAAPEAKLVPVRALGACGGYMSDIVDAIVWASGAPVPGAPVNEHPADVANLSAGAPYACTSMEQDAVDVARAHGMLLVVAAMNDARDAATTTPASCAGVVAVAAHDQSGARASFSNFGDAVTLSAPGTGIYSTHNTGGWSVGQDSYAAMGGTSMAAPHVTGAVALMVAADPTLTPEGIVQVLRGTARPSAASCGGCGAGQLDATAAVRAVAGVLPPGPSASPTPSVPTAPTSSPTAAPSSSPAPSVPACSAAAWVKDVAYPGGVRVADEGHLWEAKWWTFGERPTSWVSWGPWKDLGVC